MLKYRPWSEVSVLLLKSQNSRNTGHAFYMSCYQAQHSSAAMHVRIRKLLRLELVGFFCLTNHTQGRLFVARHLVVCKFAAA